MEESTNYDFTLSAYMDKESAPVSLSTSVSIKNDRATPPYKNK